MANQTYLGDLVDLHIHLGSASTPHFLWELAHDRGIKLPEKDYWKFIDSVTITKKTTYENYLKFFDLTEVIQSSPRSIEKAVHNAISIAFRRGDVRTIEMRFNPMLRNRGGMTDLDKIIFSAAVGMKKACLDYPVKAGLILIMDRRFDKQKNTVIAQKAVRFKNEGVVGLDLAGPINPEFKIDDIVEAVKIARKGDLKVTIHTGEVTSATEMWEVVKKLKPDRIGHGVRCVDDPKLMEHLAKHNIVLEICPTSNLNTRAVKDWKEMGEIIKTFKKYGVPFTINTDGPELLRTDVKMEFKKLLEKKIITPADVEKLREVAKKSSFIPPNPYENL